MEKTPRYTQRERNMILGFAAQYKDIIENKRTDAESNRKKDEVWKAIATEFNARVYHQRTAKQLRQLYKNMKLLLKKDLSLEGRTKNFMDILTALQQQAGMHSFISYRPNFKYEDEQKGSSSYSSDHVETDVVVIKSEELSDNEQSIKNDMDDSISIKEIPEVCLDEDDEFSIDNNLHKDYKSTEKCDSLLSLAIEERKRKIDLLNAQIDYWKALTRKLESTSSHCHCHMPRVNGINQS